MNQPKVLFIKGVFFRDRDPFVKVFEERIMSQAKDPEEVEKIEPLPTSFEDIKTWPKTTNILCFGCDMKFETMPLFVPSSIEPMDGYLKMTREGCFCSFMCASSYIHLHYTRIRDWRDRMDMLKVLYRVIKKRSVEDIPQAPDKYTMTQYGGDITADEFREVVSRWTVSA